MMIKELLLKPSEVEHKVSSNKVSNSYSTAEALISLHGSGLESWCQDTVHLHNDLISLPGSQCCTIKSTVSNDSNDSNGSNNNNSVLPCGCLLEEGCRQQVPRGWWVRMDSQEGSRARSHQHPYQCGRAHPQSKVKVKKASSSPRRRTLLLLSLIAGLALVCIVTISQQLISRHLQLAKLTRSCSSEGDLATLDCLTLGMPRTESGPWKGSDDDVPAAVFWSPLVEARLPPRPSDPVVQAQLQELRQRRVTRVELPDRLRCGREPNRFLTFEDGTNACLRFRGDRTEFVKGEVMAFYLARLLSISNVPPVVLSQTSSDEWKGTSEWENMKGVGEDKLVALIEWLPRLTKVTMPDLIRKRLAKAQSQAPSTLNPLTIEEANAMLQNEGDDDDVEDTLSQLVQWSDLVLLDYLTGNYDRLASMQDGAEMEARPEALKETVPNLALNEATGTLWFLDNESAFLDSYSLMYGPQDHVRQASGHTPRVDGGRFSEYHERALRSMCAFRRKTVERLKVLFNSPEPADLLLQFVQNNEPLFGQLPYTGEDATFRLHFRDRIRQAWNWIQQCQQQRS